MSDQPTLRPYQHEAVAFLTERPRAIEGDAPGIGKTATVISALAARDPQPTPILILCPLSVARHWEREIGRWSPYEAVVGVGSAAQRRQARETVRGLTEPVLTAYVTNYEAAKADAADLFTFPWKAVVADECHRLRNRSTKNFKIVRQLALPAPIFIGVSGTPIVNAADDLWALLHLVDPKRWRSYWKFVDQFMVSDTTTFNGKLSTPIRVVTGMREGMDGVLRQQLRDVMIRRPLAEVLPELPEIVETIYHVDLSDAERKAYNKMKEKFFTDLPGGEKVIAPNEVAKIMRLRQLSTDWSVLSASDETSTKVKRLLELVDDIGKEQIVIFSSFKTVINTIADALSAGRITGDVKSQDRTSVIDAFRKGSLRCVCGTIGAMGEGIDLQTARHIIFTDLDWVPASNEQAIARIHRYGQRADAVFVHIIAARNTIDAYIADTIADKQAVINAVVGTSWSDIVGGSAHGA